MCGGEGRYGESLECEQERQGHRDIVLAGSLSPEDRLDISLTGFQNIEVLLGEGSAFSSAFRTEALPAFKSRHDVTGAGQTVQAAVMQELREMFKLWTAS